MDLSWFLDPIQKHYVDFDGRASRKQYWMFTLYYFIVSIVVTVVAQTTGLLFIDIIVSLGLLLPSLALSFRRLHDVNKSAWWLLTMFVPILGWIYLLYLAVLKGDTGTNQYGEDPLGNVAAATPVVVTEQQPPTPPTTPVV